MNRIPACLLLIIANVAQAQITPPLDPMPSHPLQGVGYWSNEGQAHDLNDVALSGVRFYSDGVYPRTCFMDGGRLGMLREILSPDTILPDTNYRVDLVPVDAAPVVPVGVQASMEYMNFYLPHTMPNGVEQMHRYSYVVYPGLWPGIDMWVYADGHAQRIAFYCAPGSDVNNVQFRYDGQSASMLDPSGAVELELGFGALVIPAPHLYQIDGNSTEVLVPSSPASLQDVGAGQVEYTLPQVAPDTALPTVALFAEEQGHSEQAGGGTNGLCWSTYYGGHRYDHVSESVADKDNNLFVTGYTRSGLLTFPSQQGGPFVFGSSSWLATLSRFDDQEFLIWTALVGAGNGTTQMLSTAITLRQETTAMIYIGGWLRGPSPNLFTTVPFGVPSYLDNVATPNVQNGFLCRFTSTGFIQWSTYWGDDTQVFGLAISERRLVVVGATKAVLPIPMVPEPPPATSLPPQANLSSAADAYVAMLNYIDQTSWNCYLGGEAGEAAYTVRSLGGDFYVFGQTQSPDFPTWQQPGAYWDPTFNNGTQGTDAFIVRFANNLVLTWSTFFGGPGADLAGWKGLAIHPKTKDVYIVGTVRAVSLAPDNFPLQPNASGVGYFDGVKDDYMNGYIAHFAGIDLSLRWCTYFGSHFSFHFLEAVAIDKQGLIYIGGESAGTDLPVLQSNNYTYYQPSINPDYNLVADGFVAMFKPVDDVLNWCTYFGGEAGQVREHLTTLTPKENSLFAGGRTSKYQDPSTFFPLQFNGIPFSFYQDIFGDQIAPTADGFLTKFCTPWSDLDEGSEKSIEPVGRSSFQWVVVADELFITTAQSFAGISIFGTDGRLVIAEPMSNTARGSVEYRITLSGAPAGLYLAVLEGGPAFKFVKP